MVIVSPDRFPPLSTAQVADVFARILGAREIPLIDGYAGTSQHFAGERVALPTTSATGRLTEAEYTYSAEIRTAFIDAAIAAPATADADILTGDSYGVGVLIADALSRGAHTIVLAAGDAGFLDAGAGVLTALGVKLQAENGRQRSPGARGLEELSSIDLTGLSMHALGVTWIVYSPAPCGIDGLPAGVQKFIEVAEITPGPTSGSGGGLPLALSFLTTIDGSNKKVLAFNPLALTDPYSTLREECTGEIVITATPEPGPSQLTTAVRKACTDAAHVIELTGATPGLPSPAPGADWTPAFLEAWAISARSAL